MQGFSMETPYFEETEEEEDYGIEEAFDFSLPADMFFAGMPADAPKSCKTCF
jgi:hypothetical protein